MEAYLTTSTLLTSSEGEKGLKKGPWTAEEDSLLFNYVRIHGERRWNSVARAAGLQRTGKSCRLRWLNYLRPNLRRDNITLQEQLLILQLHSLWGNSWSRIARCLPGRTDNEIKNYWRTRVQKQAKQLNCDVNSQEFRDKLHHVWIPRLREMIITSSSSSQPSMGESGVLTCTTTDNQPYLRDCNMNINQVSSMSANDESNSLPHKLPRASPDSLYPQLSDQIDCQNLSGNCNIQNGRHECFENNWGSWDDKQCLESDMHVLNLEHNKGSELDEYWSLWDGDHDNLWF